MASLSRACPAAALNAISPGERVVSGSQTVLRLKGSRRSSRAISALPGSIEHDLSGRRHVLSAGCDAKDLEDRARWRPGGIGSGLGHHGQGQGRQKRCKLHSSNPAFIPFFVIGSIPGEKKQREYFTEV